MEHVVRFKCIGEAGIHLRQKVNADQVRQTEDAGFGDAEWLAHHRVGLFHRNALGHGFGHRRLNPETAKPVGDEPRPVLAGHDALAERHISKVFDGRQRIGIGLRTAHDFQQSHVAWRIEKMGDEEVAPEFRRRIAHQIGKRNGRGVGRDDGVRRFGLANLCIELALDLGLLDNGLDDPVAVTQLRHVAIDAECCHQTGIGRQHEGGRFGLEKARHGGLGNVARHIEQQHRHAGIGHLRRDTAAHDA